MIQLTKPFFQNVNNKKASKTRVKCRSGAISARFKLVIFLKDRPGEDIIWFGHILLIKHIVMHHG